jgi:plasmid maintenance system antidote protein VapI
MTLAMELDEVVAMADEPDDGLLLRDNLIRLGFKETTVKVSEVAERVGLSRQRVSALLNARRIMPETIERIAKGLGVSPKELTKKPKK